MKKNDITVIVGPNARTRASWAAASIAVLVAFTAPGPAEAAESGGGGSGQCSPDSSYKDLVVGKEGGADGYKAVNKFTDKETGKYTSSATGAYQFLAGTLLDIGVIQSIPKGGVPMGPGEWPGVVWNPELGINSREDFLNSPYAQDMALDMFTKKNLELVKGSWEEQGVVNGVPLSEGGVAFATHMLGAGDFKKWAASGFQPHGLDPDKARVNGMDLAAYNDHLMGRIASGGCYDPGMIEASMEGKIELPQVYLMPWSYPVASAVHLPGTFTVTGPATHHRGK